MPNRTRARPRPDRTTSAACALVATALAPRLAEAHGFGERFDLPLPLWLWVVGAGLTVLISFAVVVDFLPRALRRTDYPIVDLFRFRALRLVAHPVPIVLARGAALAVLAITIAAAVLGTPDPARNLAPTMVWVIGWVGLAFVSALGGDLWAVANPFRTAFAALARMSRALRAPRAAPPSTYPAWLGSWPAVAGLFAFAWAEHVWEDAALPRSLGLALLGYVAVTLAAMTAFGREAWLRYGETFSVAFSLLARCAPLELRAVGGREHCPLQPSCPSRGGDCVNGYACLTTLPRSRWTLALRPPVVGLLNDRPYSASMVVFVLLLLSTVTFDGFVETAAWRAIAEWVSTAPPVAGLLDDAARRGLDPAAILASAGLLAAPALFLGFFLACSALMAATHRLAAGAGAYAPRGADFAGHFVATLVPIAVAYHLAHYASLLIVAGQSVIPLASDPFGIGWDLFGTAGYAVDPGLVGMRTIWYFVVFAVVAGHVLSVWLSHIVALDLCASRGAAIRSEIPLIALMIAYTMVSLWLLAQPILG